MNAHSEVTVEITANTTRFTESLERLVASSRRVVVATCPVCQHYLARRVRVLAVEVCRLADQRDLDPIGLFGRYLWSVHTRHLDGESLSTRRHTESTGDRPRRITIQRSCNGCQKSLGDATPDELGRAADGLPLPDVTLECGCNAPGAAA